MRELSAKLTEGETLRLAREKTTGPGATCTRPQLIQSKIAET